MPIVCFPCRRSYLVRGAIILVFITLATHGLALFDGKVLDDFAHQKGLHEHGWSFDELMKTLRIEPATFLHTWWQEKQVIWHYFRPFFIFCMKFVFIVLGRGDPMSLHAFSLALHLISVLLVWRLCWILTRSKTWSLIGGLLFAIYPHSVVTVAWPSSQNVVLQTTLLLATMLCYLRASGLILNSESEVSTPIPKLSPGYTAWTLFFWLLAILTRENAILIPAILASMDIAYAGWRHLWARRWLYVFFGIVGVALVACRELSHIPPLPDVYCRRPAGDWGEYIPWLAAKFLHYVCASIWIAPMSVGPTGRYNPWTEMPWDCLLMIGIVAALSAIYYRAARAAPGWWIWPLWIILSIVPVMAVVATPHSGYMCGVGWAIAAALAAATAARNESKFTSRLAAGTTLVLVLGAAFMTPVNRLQWTGTYAAERHLHGWVMVSPPPKTTTDVFFINMPFVNIYAKPNLVDRLGSWAESLNVHVLTYAPRPLSMDEPSVLEQLDDYSFTVTAVGREYFSGMVGRFALEAFRGPQPLRTGDRFDSSEFSAGVLEADEHGVRKIRFTFKWPLSDSTHAFYFSSPECGAARIQFRPQKGFLPIVRNTEPVQDTIQLESLIRNSEAAHWAAVRQLILTAIAPGPMSDQASAAVRETTLYIARCLGSPLQFDIKSANTNWSAVLDWWDSEVDEQIFKDLWLHRHDFDDLVYLRYEVDWDRFIAGQFIHTDLYLTGPAWDDLRPPSHRH